MLKQKSGFSFKIAIIIALLFVSCINPLKDDEKLFEFLIVDVGQGLSQIGISGSEAIVFDLGPSDGYEEFRKSYTKSGKPDVGSVVISHRDLDHSGGLIRLDSEINWSGQLVTSKYEDTSYIKSLYRGDAEEIKIRTICSGDTLGGLDNVKVTCIWPPENISCEIPLEDQFVNRFSLAFLVQHGNTQVIITSDIDSVAQSKIASSFGSLLKSDIQIIPHHGSSSSASPVFSGYVNADISVISCALENQYGHPHNETLSVILMVGSVLTMTSLEGTVRFRSNGYYYVKF